jgi:hypothetical protein
VNPDFLCAALDRTACAALIKESRMNRPESQDEQPIFRSVAVIPPQCIENIGSSVELLLRVAQN